MSEIVNFLSKALTAAPVEQSYGITKSNGANPFVTTSKNPFVTARNANPFASYGQNKPVAGGYFAGYYNNQPNIVGRRLFIEV